MNIVLANIRVFSRVFDASGRMVCDDDSEIPSAKRLSFEVLDDTDVERNQIASFGIIDLY